VRAEMKEFRPQKSDLRSQKNLISLVVLFSVFCFLFSGLVGCGYTTGSLLPSHMKTIAVPIFKNSISPESLSYQYHPGVEVDITREVIDRFFFDGNLRVVGVGEEADLELVGELIDYIKEPLRYGPDAKDVTEYRLTLVVNISLRDLRKDVVAWEEKNFTGDATYFTTGTESSALSNAIKDLARNIVDRTVEGW